MRAQYARDTVTGNGVTATRRIRNEHITKIVFPFRCKPVMYISPRYVPWRTNRRQRVYASTLTRSVFISIIFRFVIFFSEYISTDSAYFYFIYFVVQSITTDRLFFSTQHKHTYIYKIDGAKRAVFSGMAQISINTSQKWFVGWLNSNKTIVD